MNLDNAKETEPQLPPLWDRLDGDTRTFLRSIAERYRFTFQEMRQAVQAARDLSMWREGTFQQWWTAQPVGESPSREEKKKIFTLLGNHLRKLSESAKTYPEAPLAGPPRGARKIVAAANEKKIFGRCPVYSERTVCCGLHTLDAVQGCAFSCSYCTIQTFYPDTAVVDANLAEKLKNLSLDPARFYHIGTGQASDSLVWGNREGILDALCEFAEKNPNVLLELKSKSATIKHLLGRSVPANIVPSWSLNSDTIITQEEHGTASLNQRLDAARRFADRGGRVAFHIHPMVYYDDWQAGYAAVGAQLVTRFQPHEIAFLSMGTMTFIKPVIAEIRKRGGESKVLQMPLVADPHGKLTYPKEIKVQLYRNLLSALHPWRENIFHYLCMEPADIWIDSLGWTFPSSEAFETAFGAHWNNLLHRFAHVARSEENEHHAHS